MLMVVVIIAVLLSIGYGEFNSAITRETVKNSSLQLSFALRKARYYAKANGEPVKLVFPVDSKVYSLTTIDKTMTSSEYFDVSSGQLPNNTRIIDNNCPNASFYIDGSLVNLDEAGKPQPINYDCIITVGYTDGLSKDVTIKTASGNILDD